MTTTLKKKLIGVMKYPLVMSILHTGLGLSKTLMVLLLIMNMKLLKIKNLQQLK